MTNISDDDVTNYYKRMQELAEKPTTDKPYDPELQEIIDAAPTASPPIPPELLEWLKSQQGPRPEEATADIHPDDIAAGRAALQPGDRVTDGGEPGVIVHCETCDGQGVLHQPDSLPDLVRAPNGDNDE